MGMSMTVCLPRETLTHFKNEVALWLNKEVESLTLLSYSYCITGISMPADA